MQMLQIPLVVLSRTKFFRNKDTLGNVMFWLGIYTGMWRDSRFVLGYADKLCFRSLVPV